MEFVEKCRMLDALLGVGRSFDMVGRDLCVGGRRGRLWVVNGYAEDALLERAVERLQAAPPLEHAGGAGGAVCHRMRRVGVPG